MRNTGRNSGTDFDRRDFLKIGAAAGLSAALNGSIISGYASEANVNKPKYVAVYDVEQWDMQYKGKQIAGCLEACRPIVELHLKYEMPATFFVVGKLLEDYVTEFKKLLDNPLFELATHTWSHKPLMDHIDLGKGVSLDEIREEIVLGKESIEKVFDRQCVGLRPAGGFPDGLQGHPEILSIVSEAGLSYISSQAWGPDFTLPALVRDSYTYANDGFPQLCEFPAHGYHENLIKGHNDVFGLEHPIRVLLFPPYYPDAPVLTGFVKTPEEEFEVNSKFFIDKAIEEGSEYSTLIWHPFSLYRMDPTMKMLDMTFRYVREKGLKETTFAQLCMEHR